MTEAREPLELSQIAQLEHYSHPRLSALFGQYELVVSGDSQAIFLSGMDDDDLPSCAEKLGDRDAWWSATARG